ncbi:hypothetical protein AMTRI_Chr02g222680 [Amborella trichopoda]|uniref:Phylloplanin n=1 Tax=Amborella trichopoda TaxID=13333 RepID=W1P3W6_AMBTC|nr:phylloplanin [Amborella trichopoda]ERN02261.1 hypothetical protein AMTR_s00045p00232240 [Amborella trichopoda]|eukprot:XP_006840586.1 phylloplanin [Amborella trichopoda]
MAFKSLLFVVLALVLMPAPTTHAQLGLGSLLGLTQITGTIFCTSNGNIGILGSATPVIPNAPVQLVCNGNNISTVNTDSTGAFQFLVNPLHMLLSSLLSDCSVVVQTPLTTTCKTTPQLQGILQSPLTFVGRLERLLGTVIKLAATSFTFVPFPNLPNN